MTKKKAAPVFVGVVTKSGAVAVEGNTAWQALTPAQKAAALSQVKK